MKKQLTQEEIASKFKEVFEKLNGCNEGGMGSLRKLEKLLETYPASSYCLRESYRLISLFACDNTETQTKEFAIKLQRSFEVKYNKKRVEHE
jgi:hypothetical protein